uniref:Protein jagunal homolog n=1 Tax=Caenorhabditis japonica TaxID=281687 RepID=H2WDA9_CAEJA
MWMKVGSEFLRIYLDWKNEFFVRLDMPSAYPWEYIWCFSFIPMLLCLYSFQRNTLTYLHYAYYSEFLVGIFPCMIGLGGQLPELLEYVNDMESSNTPTFKGTFPMVIIWYIFFAVALQIHGFSMYFMHNLAAAWAPVKKIE